MDTPSPPPAVQNRDSSASMDGSVTDVPAASQLKTVALEAPGRKLLAADDGAAAGSAWRLLVSHTCTKLGSKAWEFATPILILKLSSPSILAPSAYGLCVFLFKFLLGPYAGTWIDGTNRMRVVKMGIALQSVGVCVALLLVPFVLTIGVPLLLLLPFILCGILEAIGAMISSVAVKKDWVPTLWAESETRLASLNVVMSNIDLGAEIVGPLLAGLLLDARQAWRPPRSQTTATARTSAPHRRAKPHAAAPWGAGVTRLPPPPRSFAAGIVVVALANVVTFGLELLLLSKVRSAPTRDRPSRCRPPREAHRPRRPTARARR